MQFTVHSTYVLLVAANTELANTEPLVLKGIQDWVPGATTGNIFLNRSTHNLVPCVFLF